MAMGTKVPGVEVEVRTAWQASGPPGAPETVPEVEMMDEQRRGDRDEED